MNRTALFLAIGTVLAFSACNRNAGLPQRRADLFQTDKVWSIHLTLTSDQWTALEPKAQEEHVGRPDGPAGFHPGEKIASLWLKQGDADHNGELSRQEFEQFVARWFEKWDEAHAGRLALPDLKANVVRDWVRDGERPFGFPPGRFGAPAESGSDRYPSVRADLRFEGVALPDVSVRYKGNNTYRLASHSLKRSFKINLNQNNPGRKLAGVTTLNLHNNVADPDWMSEALSYRLYREAGVSSPQTGYTRIYLTVPGRYDKLYLGLYSIVENIDKDFTREHFGGKTAALFKPFTGGLFEYRGEDWSAYDADYRAKKNGGWESERRVIEFSKLVSQANDAEFADRLGAYVDVDEFARYMAVTVLLGAMDSILDMGQNYYLALDPATQKFQILPWDLDLSFGRFGNQVRNESLNIYHPWRGQKRFLERLFATEAFRTRYLGYVEQFNQTLFTPEQISRQVDALSRTIRPAVQEESKEKLAVFDQLAAGQSTVREPLSGPAKPPGGSGPGPRGATDSIKQFVAARHQSILKQLVTRAAAVDSEEERGSEAENFIALEALDRDRTGVVTRQQFIQGAMAWFGQWDADRSGTLSAEELQRGLMKTLLPGRAPGFLPRPVAEKN